MRVGRQHTVSWADVSHVRTWYAVIALISSACASTGQQQDGTLAHNAPVDRPVEVTATFPSDALAKWRTMIAPHVEQARATYPGAKSRYLSGLPRGETFFVTVILVDEAGRFEQVFILVNKIDGGVVEGRIASNIMTVRGYARDEVRQFSEADIVDWLIARPDGSEEGNVVGKFLDTLPQPRVHFD